MLPDPMKLFWHLGMNETHAQLLGCQEYLLLMLAEGRRRARVKTAMHHFYGLFLVVEADDCSGGISYFELQDGRIVQGWQVHALSHGDFQLAMECLNRGPVFRPCVTYYRI